MTTEVGSNAKFIRVKNWAEYQHYKDRSAPWIKLHREMLSSHFWVMGDDASKLLAICIMLLAQRTDNKIPLDLEYIKRFSHLDQTPDLAPLLDSQFIEIIDDSGCLQTASEVLATCPSEENRGEENRVEKPSASADQVRDILPPEFVEAWDAYPKREGGDSRASALKAWKARVKAGVPESDMLAGVQRYAAFCVATKKVGTQYVKQAATFFGPDEHWNETWAITAPASPDQINPKTGARKAGGLWVI